MMLSRMPCGPNNYPIKIYPLGQIILLKKRIDKHKYTLIHYCTVSETFSSHILAQHVKTFILFIVTYCNVSWTILPWKFIQLRISNMYLVRFIKVAEITVGLNFFNKIAKLICLYNCAFILICNLKILTL